MAVSPATAAALQEQESPPPLPGASGAAAAAVSAVPSQLGGAGIVHQSSAVWPGGAFLSGPTAQPGPPLRPLAASAGAVSAALAVASPLTGAVHAHHAHMGDSGDASLSQRISLLSLAEAPTAVATCPTASACRPPAAAAQALMVSEAGPASGALLPCHATDFVLAVDAVTSQALTLQLEELIAAQAPPSSSTPASTMPGSACPASRPPLPTSEAAVPRAVGAQELISLLSTPSPNAAPHSASGTAAAPALPHDDAPHSQPLSGQSLAEVPLASAPPYNASEGAAKAAAVTEASAPSQHPPAAAAAASSAAGSGAGVWDDDVHPPIQQNWQVEVLLNDYSHDEVRFICPSPSLLPHSPPSFCTCAYSVLHGPTH